MSTHPQTASATNADQRLSQLLKLKQLEKPDAAYWEKFDQEFRSRQLTTFVQIQPIRTRIRRACLILARKAAPPVAAAGTVALTFFAVTNARYLTDGPETEIQPTIPALAANEADEQQVAYFIVDTETSAATPGEVTSDDTIYQVNALSSSGSSSNGYLLNATPVTYSQPTAEQASGANVLRKQPNY